jgi:hypothetical protein
LTSRASRTQNPFDIKTSNLHPLQVGDAPEPTAFLLSRLNEAAYLDEEKLKPHTDRLNPKNGTVLWHGMLVKEGSSKVAGSFQSRYVVVDLDQQWNPSLK